jgi:hypothetical protein
MRSKAGVAKPYLKTGEFVVTMLSMAPSIFVALFVLNLDHKTRTNFANELLQFRGFENWWVS